MTDACVPYESLERYATGVASAVERSAVETHAAGCETCRLTLAAVGLAFEPGSAEEEALVAWMASARPVSALLADLGVHAGSQPEPIPGKPMRPHRDRGGSRSRWAAVRSWRVVAGGAVVALAASLALLLFVPAEGPLSLPHRSLQGRPAALVHHAPFVAIRGSGSVGGWEKVEAALATEGKGAGPVAVLLARGGPGDWERAEMLLAEEADAAVRANDRGVLLLAEGQAAAALRSFEEAMRLDAGLVAARFNRALALEALGRKGEARKAWEAYLGAAGEDDAGWREEARRYLVP
ncbi:tetratricopeptide repeat protein [Vulgatibacter sp.]|uniref:tetratricopeptide repeat protein n=1 Tax=Vulgatibacter sp. TaxID=1971226 RepID=UPI003565ED49